MLSSCSILRKKGFFPKKHFGQNFLNSEKIAQRIAQVSVAQDEIGQAHVLEIGAGTGALTSYLLARANCLSAVERDRDLIPILKENFAEAIEHGTLQVIEADAQTLHFSDFLESEPPGSLRVLVGNLPYCITGRLLRCAVHQVDQIFDERL